MQEKHEVRLSFEAIKLPPVTDILVLGSHYQHGKLGIFESLKILAPGQFSSFDINMEEFPNIGIIFVSNRILKRIDIDKLTEVLGKYVFPYIDEIEAINVDLSVKKSFVGIEL